MFVKLPDELDEIYSVSGSLQVFGSINTACMFYSHIRRISNINSVLVNKMRVW